MNTVWPWFTLLLLGAYHGLNPGMGWLFALSLGLQERSRRAVISGLLPIAMGHASAISLTIFTLRLLQATLSPRIVQGVVIAALFSLGIWRFSRSRHPTGGGIRVGKKELTLWSFAMASAHGAGLMLAPILLAAPMLGMQHSMPHAAASVASLRLEVLGLAVTIHTLGLLLVAGALALSIYQTYERWGLRLLQRAWFNFDLLWAVALSVAGLAVLFI